METLLASAGAAMLLRGPRSAWALAARSYALLDDGTAVVEMAQASGLALIDKRKRDVLGATSYGTGELIRSAIENGAKSVVVGLGGSATNDGGAGMAQALGARFLDAFGRELPLGAAALLRLARLEWGTLPKLTRGGGILAVSDVTNPLLGAKGSARVFGPQKGRSRAGPPAREGADSLRETSEAGLGARRGAQAEAGAAGGLGAGLMAFLGAELVPGAAWVLGELEAGHRLQGADAALTGEGWLDQTSFFGKRRSSSPGGPRLWACRWRRFAGGMTRRSCGGSERRASRRSSHSPRRGRPRRTRIAGRRAGRKKAASLAVKRLLLAAVCLGFLVGPVLAEGLAKADVHSGLFPIFFSSPRPFSIQFCQG